MPDETIRGLATQVGGEFGIFSGAHKTTQRDLALQALLKLRVALNVRGKVSGVINEVLRNGIYLNIVGRNLHADVLHVSKLGAPCGAVC